MITQVLHCPNCHGTDIVKHGKSPEGKQRYKCRESICDGRTFILDYAYPGQSRQVKQQIVDVTFSPSNPYGYGEGFKTLDSVVLV